MTTLRRRVREYLALRRGLGFKLIEDERLLLQFVDYMEEQGAVTITTELALGWAKKPSHTRPRWSAKRLQTVRVFAEHMRAIEPSTEVPPRDLLPALSHRATPCVYSERDVARLLAATSALSPRLRARTYSTLFALLAVTGMRVGEAVALDEDDVDWRHGTIHVRRSKFGKSRLIPVEDSTITGLHEYERFRKEADVKPRVPAFFLSTRGTRLIYKNVHRTFLQLVIAAGLNPRPRIHDLRHTFAVRTLIDWYRAELDVDALLPRLSTYLGHVDPTSTYWYLSASPELLELAARHADRTHARRS